ERGIASPPASSGWARAPLDEREGATSSTPSVTGPPSRPPGRSSRTTEAGRGSPRSRRRVARSRGVDAQRGAAPGPRRAPPPGRRAQRERAPPPPPPAPLAAPPPGRRVPPPPPRNPAEPRQDLTPTNGQQRAMDVEPGAVRGIGEERPVELGALEGRARERIGDAGACCLVGELREGRELSPPALAHRIGQLWPDVAEEDERLRRVPFLPHEEQRDRRGQEHDRRGGAQRFRRRQRPDALAHGPVTDLIVVLEERDEGGRRQVCTRLSAPPAAVGRVLALEVEALGERAAEPCPRCVGMVGVVASGLSGRQHVQEVVE